jgi:hypothetical protein
MAKNEICFHGSIRVVHPLMPIIFPYKPLPPPVKQHRRVEVENAATCPTMPTECVVTQYHKGTTPFKMGSLPEGILVEKLREDIECYSYGEEHDLVDSKPICAALCRIGSTNTGIIHYLQECGCA